MLLFIMLAMHVGGGGGGTSGSGVAYMLHVEGGRTEKADRLTCSGGSGS